MLSRVLPLMQRPNFCVECGERLALKGWSARLGRRYCEPCSRRLGTVGAFRPIIMASLLALAAFAFGRYLRPAPPPLIIQRAANSPLSDSPAGPGRASDRVRQANQNQFAAGANEEAYICGARTRKGSPCRRRVHVAGERCFQHKGLPSLVPLSKLVIRPKN